MAFPVVQTTAASTDGTDVTTHVVTMPSGLVSGDLALVFFCANGSSDSGTWPGGWTKVLGAGANGISAAWGWRVSDGTEGASISISTVAQQSASRVYRITGHASSTNPPEGVAGWGSGATSTPDISTNTPTGGAKDYLWIWACAADSGYVVTALPTNFTNLLQSDSGSTANGSAAMSTGQQNLNAASLDPAAATLEAAEGWLCQLIAIHPGAEGGGGGGGTAVLDPFGMAGFFGA